MGNYRVSAMVETHIRRLNAWWHLLRIPNLLMLALMLVLSQRYLYQQSWASIGQIRFLIFSLCVILTAAAGYLINDYYDVKIDALNRPDRVFVGRKVSRWQVLFIYMLINSTALLLAISISVWLALFVLLCQAVLWFYSGVLKRTLFWGNAIVSLMLAFPLVGLAFLHGYAPAAMWLYAAFAFLSTFIREVIKDMEDMQGDAEHGCRTLAIVWGIARTRKLLYGLLMIMGLLLLAGFHYLPSRAAWFLVISMSTFTAYIYRRLAYADRQQDFRHLSQILKLMMLVGIVSLLFF